MTGVLEGIRVLDFGRFIAGPWCGALLADMGAEVIRIEKVDGGEDRGMYPLGKEDITGAMFVQCNRNKQCLTLNPKKSEGRAIQDKLVTSADIIIANMPPGTLEQLGLDYKTLKTRKEDIILVTATAFGTMGPYASKVGLDSVAQAMSGNMYISGTPGQPVKSFSPWVDYATASLSAFGAMAALRHRDATGEGQEVQGALLASALATTNALMIEQHVLEPDREATLNRGQIAAPADDFKTKDGHIFVTSAGQPMFERWVDLMRADGGDEDHWLNDPRFKDDVTRGYNSEEISNRMREWCARRTTEEALAQLAEARIPSSPVLSPRQALENEHVRESGMLRKTTYPGIAKDIPVVATPVRLTKTPGEIRTRPPKLGEHTDKILGELGYSKAEISKLRTAGIV